MKKTTKMLIFTFLLAIAAGVLLHGLYHWLPNPIFALVAPVRESVWEHVKLLFYPLLVVSLVVTKGSPKAARTPWLLSLLIVCAMMLAISYIYFITLRGESSVFGPVLYVILMAAGFLLPRMLWPFGEWPGVDRAAVILTGMLWLFIVCFSFFQPSGALFADLSGAVRTFFTIPV